VLPVAKPKTTGPKQRHHLDRRAGLADEGKGNADELLTSKQVADWLGITEFWIWKGRRDNFGPVFVQPFPEVIRYRRGDVIKWLRERARAVATEYA
jgi:hypothetical protein